MPIELNVNGDAVVSLTNKLEKLHKSAFPVAVRTTLNSGAFDVKQKTMPSNASLQFEERRKNFFKANSRVEKAGGFDVDNMESRVGFISRSGKNQAVEDLEQQEYGGRIKGRSYIPMDPARVSKSNKRNVRKMNRTSVMPNVVNARNVRGRSQQQRFVKAVAIAGVGGVVLSSYRGKEILWRVNSIRRKSNGSFNITPIYSYKKGRSVQIKSTHFMRKSSLQSGEKLNDFYVIEAKKQIKRLTGK